METYELVCYALAPELSPEEAQAHTRAVLPDAPRPAPGIRLGILPLAAARHAQRELTAAGVICNYRPATPELYLSLAESRHTRRCQHRCLLSTFHRFEMSGFQRFSAWLTRPCESVTCLLQVPVG